MFVKNLTNEVLTIRKSGNVLKLQPGMNCVDETKWSADFILTVYGSKYITIINREVEELEEVTPLEDTTDETPVEQSTEIPVDVPTEPTVDTPVEQPVENPTDTPVETPVETTVDTPADVPTETPADNKPVEDKPKKNARTSSKKTNQ